MSSADGIYPIATIGAGRLAIGPHPASSADADSRIAGFAASGVQQVISLLEPAEAAALGLEREAELVTAHSMVFFSLPIADMGSPQAVDEFAQLSRRLYRQIHEGVNTLIHCRAGVGRSGLLAAAVLMHGERDALQAFARVAKMRGMPLPETGGQGAWLVANQARIKGCDT